MATKITDRVRYEKIAEIIPEYAEWAQGKIAQMDKRNERRKGAEKKPTKAQLESIALEPAVLEALTDEGQPVKAIAEKVGVAFQKVTPILVRLINDGKATREKVKGVNLYSLAIEVEIEE